MTKNIFICEKIDISQIALFDSLSTHHNICYEFPLNFVWFEACLKMSYMVPVTQWLFNVITCRWMLCCDCICCCEPGVSLRAWRDSTETPTCGWRGCDQYSVWDGRWTASGLGGEERRESHRRRRQTNCSRWAHLLMVSKIIYLLFTHSLSF